MKLLDNGDPELKVKEGDNDIIMADPYATEVYDIDDRYVGQRRSKRLLVSYPAQ